MAFRPSAIASSIRRLFLVIGVSALCGILLAGLALPVMGGLGLGARESADWFHEMELDFEPNQLSETSRIENADGDKLATFFEENRKYVKLEDISDVMVDAILAVEDDRFFERGPIDFQGTLRALARNVEAGSTQGGGSTLTQQYVKQVRLSQAKTPEEQQKVLDSTGIDGYRRKLDELRMAINVEQEFTKEEILERYLNIAYFGSRAYGIEAAARTYFSTSAKDLNLTQAATLAGLVQSPNEYDPTENPDAAKGRRNIVLNRMAETDRISEKKVDKAVDTKLNLDPSSVSNGCVSASAGYFCDYVVNEIRTMEELGKTRDARMFALKNGGLTIETTLDEDVQEAADEAVSNRVAPDDDSVAALASVEPSTGYIKALSNSREYGIEGEGVSNINYAVDKDMGGGVGMQPGSGFKPLFLAAAIDQGISINTRIDSPTTISLPVSGFETCDGSIQSSETWSLKNYDSTSGGLTMREATYKSVNTFYAQLAQRTGLCEPLSIAKKAGLTKATGEDFDAYPSVVLGAQEVSPLGMAGVYAMFANRGKFCEPTAIVRVLDRNGKVLVDNTDPDCDRVLDKEVADGVNDVLQGVIHDGGTGSPMALDDGRKAGGKTGTTNDAKAVWFNGYVPQLATSVAVADVDPPQESLHGRTFNGETVAEACGGCLPGPTWQEFMNEALEGKKKEEFNKPDGSVIEGVSTTVPDVRGMNSDEAIETLEAEGFSASVTDRINSDLPEGQVVNSDPGAGSEVPSGSSIRLFVSNGQPPENEDDDDDDDDDNGGDENGDNGNDNGDNGDNGGWDEGNEFGDEFGTEFGTDLGGTDLGGGADGQDGGQNDGDGDGWSD